VALTVIWRTLSMTTFIEVWQGLANVGDGFEGWVELHVVPVERTGRWVVHDTEPSWQPEFDTQTAAESAARAWARRHVGAIVVIHDRYHRTREIAPGNSR
jgi:hypothetical protein